MHEITTCPRCRGSLADHISECACGRAVLCGTRLPSLDVTDRPAGFARLLCGLITLGVLVIVLLALLPAEDRATKKMWLFGQLLTVAVLDVIVVAGFVRALTRWSFEGRGPQSVGAAVLFLLCVLVYLGVIVGASGVVYLLLASPLL